MHKACRRCLVIRWFLMTAVPLIVMIGFQPDGAVALAKLMPATEVIGAGVLVMAVGGFWLRLKLYRAGKIS